MTGLDDFLEASGERVDAELRRWLPTDGRLGASMAHITFSGGKRLRPALVLLGCRDVGGDDADALAAAAAVELVHAYSLVHDDLPCMDDAKLRRGKPCVHVEYGEALAVLAGDALLTLAFEVLARGTPEGAPVAAMVATLAEGAGWAGMVGGQVADLEGEEREPDIDLVRRIHLGKTAALLSTCLKLGALAGRGDPDQVERLGAVGRDLGLAFQIVDDLLDVEGTTDELGKDAGADAGHGKQTWPAVVGVERSRDDARRLAAEAVARAREGRAAALLEELAEKILRRRS